MTTPAPLKLKAYSPQEMDIFSALVQDALLTKTAFSYNKKEKRVHLLVNRFCWEQAVVTAMSPDSSSYYRVYAGLYFYGVEQLRVNIAFQQYPAEKILNLLTIHADGKKEVNILFSEGAHICLDMPRCRAYLKDLHEGWPTALKPNHSA
ncbi:MAG: DUF2948 family protein [Holosporales bacterium]|jgi:hypothetical protein|nr:DUF2948 family protein [Holosporales bacterium]